MHILSLIVFAALLFLLPPADAAARNLLLGDPIGFSVTVDSSSDGYSARPLTDGLIFEAVDSVGRIVRLPAASRVQPDFSIDVTDDRSAPLVEHTPVDHHVPGQPLEIRARVTDESGVDRVRLHYRPTRQTMEYTTVVMQRRGSEYVATIPGQAIDPAFDLLYYLEALDVHGNGRFHPDPDLTQPYVVVKIRR